MRNPFVFLSVLLCLLVTACRAPGGGAALDLGVVGSVQAGSSDTEGRPALLVRYDGDVFVAWAEGRAEASLFWRDSDPRTYPVPPRAIAGGRAVVRVNSLDQQWEGQLGDPLPIWCRPLFSPEEVIAWNLQFALIGEP